MTVVSTVKAKDVAAVGRARVASQHSSSMGTRSALVRGLVASGWDANKATSLAFPPAPGARRGTGVAYAPGVPSTGGPMVGGAGPTGATGVASTATSPPSPSTSPPREQQAQTPDPKVAALNDPGYLGDRAALDARLQTTLTNIAGQRDRAGYDYGYKATYDADGNLVGDLQVDPSNPFSRAALQKRLWDQSQQGNRTGYAARGQLYSGAFQNARDHTDFEGLRQQTGTQDAFRALIAGLVGQTRQAKTDYAVDDSGAVGRALARVLGQGGA